MILRQWSAEMRSSLVDEYTDYFKLTGAKDYGATPGNLGYQLLFQRIDEQRTRVMTLSWWTSEEAIRKFAGDDYTRARYYPDDKRFMLTFPENVDHFAVPIARMGRGMIEGPDE
jgi:heme-degrading monooxygenase HmoA